MHVSGLQEREKFKRILLAFSDAGGLNARPQSFAVRNKRKVLRFTAGTPPFVLGEPPRPRGFRSAVRMGPRSLTPPTHPQAPSALAGRRPLLAICSEAPMPASPLAFANPAFTPSQGLPARVPPQTAPRDGWDCRRRRWHSGDTRGRNRRARESRSLPGS